MPDFTEDGVIFVDYGHVDDAVANMVQQTRAIDQTVTNLIAECDTLSQSWEGQDKQAYQNKKAEWDRLVADLERLLNSHSQLLSEIGGSYQYSERSLSQMWSGVTVRG
ncbi:WXG100 family type VII secretion target [Streptomyces sp. NPDC026673]|uniref:WXG100 family type VII secretion target n=1 Tax=Streptomyces sp. NPDC026673 TaxID=3155724 RepID=UPI0033D9E15F